MNPMKKSLFFGTKGGCPKPIATCRSGCLHDDVRGGCASGPDDLVLNGRHLGYHRQCTVTQITKRWVVWVGKDPLTMNIWLDEVEVRWIWIHDIIDDDDDYDDDHDSVSMFKL